MSEIVTERLIMKPFEVGDEGLFKALKKDVANMAGTTVGPLTDEAASGLFQGYLQQWRADGLGIFALWHRDTHTFIGECGFAKRDDMPELTLRYTLEHVWWGRGLAPESVAAAVRHLFEATGTPEFSALALSTNSRSVRILEGVGMHLIQEGFGGIANFRRYHLTESQWRDFRVDRAKLP